MVHIRYRDFTSFIYEIAQVQFSSEERFEINNNKTDHDIEQSYLLGLLDKLSGTNSFSNFNAQLPDFTTATENPGKKLTSCYSLLPSDCLQRQYLHRI